MKKQHILYITSINPKDTTLSFVEEIRDMEYLMLGKVALAFEFIPKIGLDREHCRKAVYAIADTLHLVHFSLEGNHKMGLKFAQRDTDVPDFSDTKFFKRLFESLSTINQRIPCVIFSAAYSKAYAEAIAPYVHFSIGIEGYIEHRAILEFNKGFYQHFLEGNLSVERCFKQAINYVKYWEEDNDNGITASEQIHLIDTKNRQLVDNFAFVDNNDKSPSFEAGEDNKGNKLTDKKYILFLAAEPNSKVKFNAANELQIIQDALQKSKNQNSFEIIIHFKTTISDLNRLLLSKQKPFIVHLCMHGSQKGIFFQGDNENAESVSPEILSGYFEQVNSSKTLKCVLLSACNSKEHAKQIKAFVNHAVGMDGAILADAAQKYTQGFYDSIFADSTFTKAHNFGVLAVEQFANSIEYHEDKPLKDMPILFTSI